MLRFFKFLLLYFFILKSVPLFSQSLTFNVGYGKSFLGRPNYVNEKVYYSALTDLNYGTEVVYKSFGNGLNLGIEFDIESEKHGLYFSPFVSYLSTEHRIRKTSFSFFDYDFELKYEIYGKMLNAGLLFGKISHLGNTSLIYQLGIENMMGIHYKEYLQLGEAFNPKSLFIKFEYLSWINPGFSLRFQAVQKFDHSMSLGLSVEYRNQIFIPKQRKTVAYVEDGESKLPELDAFDILTIYESKTVEKVNDYVEEVDKSLPNREPKFALTYNSVMLNIHVIFNFR